jgi:hypothetical protein
VADCKDIDRALANLSRKIDAQNRCCEANKKAIADLNNRLRNLERGNKPNSQKDKPQDLTDIYKRLNRLEQYCLSIESLFTQIGNVVKPIISIFK